MERATFKVKIIGIVFNPETKEILLGKRKDEEKYSFLDGDLNYEEDLDISLKRVVKEKTGYEVKNLGVVFARNHLKGKDNDKLNLYFLCEISDGKEKSLEDEELIWVKSAEEIEEKFGRHLTSRLKEYVQNITGK